MELLEPLFFQADFWSFADFAGQKADSQPEEVRSGAVEGRSLKLVGVGPPVESCSQRERLRRLLLVSGAQDGGEFKIGTKPAWRRHHPAGEERGASSNIL